MRLLQIAGALLILLTTAFMLVGVAIPEFDYSNRIEVERPRPSAFSAFNDSSSKAHWMNGFISIEHTSGPPDGEGSRRQLKLLQGQKRIVLKEEVVRFVPDSLLEIRIDSAVLTSFTTYRFIRIGSVRTLIKNDTRIVGSNPLWQSILPLFKSSIKEANQANLSSFKRWMEVPNDN